MSSNPFSPQNVLPNPVNQTMYRTALTSYNLVVNAIKSTVPGLLEAFDVAYAQVKQTGMDTNGAMDNAWTAYQSAQHAEVSDTLTYFNQLFGWYETWYFNTIQASSPPPSLPASLASYIPGYKPVALPS